MVHTGPWCIQAHGAYRPMAHTGPWCIQAHGAYRPMVHTCPWCIQAHGAYRPMVHTGPWCIQAHGAYRPMVHTCDGSLCLRPTLAYHQHAPASPSCALLQRFHVRRVALIPFAEYAVLGVCLCMRVYGCICACVCTRAHRCACRAPQACFPLQEGWLWSRSSAHECEDRGVTAQARTFSSVGCG